MTEQPEGRDLTKAVAETLGWTEIVWDDGYDQHVGLMPDGQAIEFVPDYAADPAAALEALDMFCRQSGQTLIPLRRLTGVVTRWTDENGDTRWACEIRERYLLAHESSTTPAEAICRAILATQERAMRRDEK